MSVIPAQVAGVESIAVTSPATTDGTRAPAGGRRRPPARGRRGARHRRRPGDRRARLRHARPIAAVDKVVGPGNLFVTLAKREVFGAVDIDQLAGPSEIMVVASDGADADGDRRRPRLAARARPAGLGGVHHRLGRARGGGRGAASTRGAGGRARAGHHRRLRRAARRGGASSTTSRTRCRLVRAFAPEHLSLQGRAAEALRDRVRGAGAVFCGALSPVSMGDYIAGPNHTLPTQGAARYRGPLSVMDFVRWPSVVDLTGEEFDSAGPGGGDAGRRRGPARARAGDPAAHGGASVDERAARRTRCARPRRRASSARSTVDGSGRARIELPLPFFRHMIESFVKYSGMDVELSGRGDVEVDSHHLVEDTGLVLGGCVAEALGDRAGIARFGHAYAPLDESLVRCALDYGKRPARRLRDGRAARAHQRLRRQRAPGVRARLRAERRHQPAPRPHPRRQPAPHRRGRVQGAGPGHARRR